MTRHLVIATTVLAIGSATVASLSARQGADPFVGTWRLNVAKSTYSPGPVPKAATTTIDAAGKGYRFSVRQEQASGPVQWSFTTNLDGLDAPVTGSNPNADVVAGKRISPTSIELVNKKGGKVTVTQTSVVSADGKTRTVTTKGSDASGRAVSNVAVYEKQ
jgi:hypothetical protein